MDDWSPSRELVRVRKYLQAITALLAVLVLLVGYGVFTRVVAPGLGSLIVYAAAVFVIGLVAYILYALWAMDSNRETTAE